MHFRAIHSPKFANLLTLVMSFDDALTHANFSFVYFLQFHLLKFFLTFFNGGFEPPNPPVATPLAYGGAKTRKQFALREWLYR